MAKKSATQKSIEALQDQVEQLIFAVGLSRLGMSPEQAAFAAGPVHTVYEQLPSARMQQRMMDSAPNIGQRLGNRLPFAIEVPTNPITLGGVKVVKRKRKPLKGMSSAMKEANQKARKKNGEFRMGWDHAKLMKTAHKIRRKKTGTKGRRR